MGINGRLFGRVPDVIFLPFTGRCEFTSVYQGLYWSANSNYDNSAGIADWLSIEPTRAGRVMGLVLDRTYSVRCVAE